MCSVVCTMFKRALDDAIADIRERLVTLQLFSVHYHVLYVTFSLTRYNITITFNNLFLSSLVTVVKSRYNFRRTHAFRGCSSVGRAPRSQRRGRRFEPAQLHHTVSLIFIKCDSSLITFRRSLGEPLANSFATPP